MTADPALYDRLERLTAEATPGPWQNDPAEPDTVWGADEGVITPIVATTRAPLNAAGLHAPDADAALIVALHNAAPDLIAAARRATNLEQRVRALADELEGEANERTGDYPHVIGERLWLGMAAARLRALLAAAAPDTEETTA